MPNVYLPAEAQPAQTLSEHPATPPLEITAGKLSCKAQNAPATQQAGKGLPPTNC